VIRRHVSLTERGEAKEEGGGHGTLEFSNRGGTAVPKVSEILQSEGIEGDRPDETDDARGLAVTDAVAGRLCAQTRRTVAVDKAATHQPAKYRLISGRELFDRRSVKLIPCCYLYIKVNGFTLWRI